jgi:hypothetical protein
MNQRNTQLKKINDSYKLLKEITLSDPTNNNVDINNRLLPKTKNLLIRKMS